MNMVGMNKAWMKMVWRRCRVMGQVALLVCAVGTGWCQDQGGAASLQEDPQLVIENESPLPDTYPHGFYQVHLRARGGTTPLHWRVERGALPPGMKLEDEGLLHGEAERTGEFQFTVSATDSGAPRLTAHKMFVIRVRSGFSLNWKSPARVNGNRIEGSVEVTNTTPDDLDLTFIVLAVAGNGRATAIGYQHFLLRKETLKKELPFGDTLPRGGYVVHADAVGEAESKKLIYRERLQTPEALQVMVGP
ncbi:MAG TPA: cadherin repeat domain-containing protein [Candidatus Sulfotelmatobacter sp.]|nr:cadherin repeat domain-containing protein [Candidatus Sulfotelmatobacter sp.]